MFSHRWGSAESVPAMQVFGSPTSDPSNHQPDLGHNVQTLYKLISATPSSDNMCPILEKRPGLPALPTLSQAAHCSQSAFQDVKRRVLWYPHRRTLSSGLSNAPKHVSDPRSWFQLQESAPPPGEQT